MSSHPIEISCCITSTPVESVIQRLNTFGAALKEDLKFTPIAENIRHFIEGAIRREGAVILTDDASALPASTYYKVKQCRIYYYIDDPQQTLQWVKNPLIDGIVHPESDTTIHAFLADSIAWKYRIHEHDFIKPMADWLGAGSWDYQMLTVSFGKMAAVYNELKKFIYFEQLQIKFSDSQARNLYGDLIRMIQRMTISNYEEQIDLLLKKVERVNSYTDEMRRKQVRTISILLTGESGVGKSLLAGFVQNYLMDGSAAGSRVAKINCSQLSREQIRIELFGAMPGSYTDQPAGIPGKLLENAMKVLILDEIGDMDISLQPQLLSFLDDSRIHMVNGHESVFCPIVLLAATNRNIREEIAEGNFRRDLYQRFDLHLHIPPLRERKQEIKPFVKLMFSRMRAEDPMLFKRLGISKACLDELCSREYADGNFRELSHVIQQTVRNTISRGSDTIMLSDLNNR